MYLGILIMALSLLIIEDEPEFADYLRRGLTYDGYRVQTVPSAEQGLEELRRNQPDLIILDVMLPGLDGMTACRQLRDEGYSGPVLMLTARNSVDDRIAGLDAGADHYMAKPFEFDELLARLRALFRRLGIASEVLSFSDLKLDVNLRAAMRSDKTISLSRTEYNLLAFLLSNPECVISRDKLIEIVGKGLNENGSSVLDVYISRLRRKLGDPPLIHTVYATGYILKE